MRLLKSSLLFVALLFLVHLVHLPAAAGGRGESSRTSKSPKHDRDKAHISATAGDAGDSIDIARMPRDYWIQLRKAYNDEASYLSKSEIMHLRGLKDGELHEAYQVLHDAAEMYREALKSRLNAIKSVTVPSPDALIEDDQDIAALQCGLEKQLIPGLLKKIKRFLPIDKRNDPWELSKLDVETRRKRYRRAVQRRQGDEQREKHFDAVYDRFDNLLLKEDDPQLEHEKEKEEEEEEKEEEEEEEEEEEDAQHRDRERRGGGGGGGQTSVQGRAGSAKSRLHRCHLKAVTKWEAKVRREATTHTESKEEKENTGPPLPLDDDFLSTQPSRKLLTELRSRYNAELLKCGTEGGKSSFDADFHLQMAHIQIAALDYSDALGHRLNVIDCNIRRLKVGHFPRSKPSSIRNLLLEFEMEKESVSLILKKLKVNLPILPEDELPISIKKMTMEEKTEKLTELSDALEKREKEERIEAGLIGTGFDNKKLKERRRKETELLREALKPAQAQADLKERRRKEAEGRKEGLKDQAGPSA
ncbi:hypothetical protein FA10DRAFT_294937 [Acaromyces ingoldii]|uniref:Uncharacterized protein n=1 Tax=Acaromyces ingoldii TaxID=215250 RepID=A0A316YJW8_9BASI|nr:hypothetical protein FA10DRAFT_294937 [Acaromyces ingoldii]PWN89104.1 hypothetical protein FA10DRAFT_294937 [Acaromyces ingoldii]